MGDSRRPSDDRAEVEDSASPVARAAPALYRNIEQVADSVGDSVVIADTCCTIRYANAAAGRMFGVDRLWLIGRRCDDPALGLVSIDGEQLPGDDLACRRALGSGEPQRGIELAIRRPDGETSFVLVSASPLHDETGRIVGVVNSYADITKLKRAEDALRERDELNSSLLRLYGRLGTANTYSAILDALRPEIAGVLGYESVWLQLFREESRDLLLLDAGGPIEEAVKRLLQEERFRTRIHGEEFLILPITGDPYLTEVVESTRVHVVPDARTHPLTNKDIVAITGNRTIVGVPLMLAGKRVGFLSTGTLLDEGVRVPTGSLVEWLTALSHHVAVAMDRVRFLGEKAAAEEALRASEERYRRFVETSIEGVWARDTSGNTTFVSDRMAGMLKCSPEEMLGRPVLDFVFDEDAPGFAERMRRHRDGEAESYEMRFRCADGSGIWLHLSATMVEDERGNVQGSFAMASDVSERKHAERELERLVGELQSLLGGVVAALSSTTSQRDPYTALHQERVATLACAIAVRLGLEPEVIDGIRTAALLHDIGKISVPSDILSKPGALSEMEMGIVRTHPTIGHRLLAPVAFGRPVARAVLQHHERLDGSGYPDGLVGEEVLLEAKILAVADVVEAMSSFRPYRPALGMEAALAEIQAYAGVKYDPGVVAACTRVIRDSSVVL